MIVDFETAVKVVLWLAASIGGAYLLLKYLSQKLFENYLTKGLEEFKSKLERDVITHRIKFESLHKERAEIARDLFSLISHLVGATYRFTVTFTPQQFGGVNSNNYQIHLQHLDKVLEMYNNLMALIAEKEIYFESNFIESIRLTARPMGERVLLIGQKISTNEKNLTPTQFLDPEFFKANNLALDEQVRRVKNLAAEEFRKLTGTS